MIFGDPSEFAIESEVTESSDRWIFGRLVFIVPGGVIGNPDDAADLRGCRNWMREFLARPVYVVGADVLALTPTQFFSMVFDPAMARGGHRTARYPDAFRRFSISHLGMSSFDRFDVILLERPDGGHRLLWREAGGAPRGADVDPGAFRRAIEQCANWMDASFPPA